MFSKHLKNYKIKLIIKTKKEKNCQKKNECVSTKKIFEFHLITQN